MWGPHLPPGRMSSAAVNQQFDIKVMAVMAAPVMLLVLIYFGYALVVWRQREGDEEDGPAAARATAGCRASGSPRRP